MSTQFAPIWNNASVDFSCIKANVTDSNSGSNSTLLDLQVGGVSQFRVDKTGGLTIANPGRVAAQLSRSVLIIGQEVGANYGHASYSSALGFVFRANTTTGAGFAVASNSITPTSNGAMHLGWPGLAWASLRLATFNTTDTAELFAEGISVLAQRNGTSAQTFRIYNTTDAGLTNYERAKIAWESNVLKIGTEGLGTGASNPRAMEFQTAGTTRLTIGTDGRAFFTNEVWSRPSNDYNGYARLTGAGNAYPNIVLGSYSLECMLLLNGPGSGTVDLRCPSTFRIQDQHGINPQAMSAGAATFKGNVTVSAVNLVTDTTTGTKIGTATTQKLGFWNATPIVQPANTVAIDDVLVNTGLRASGGVNNFTNTLDLTIRTVTYGATMAIDAALGNKIAITLAGNGTISNPTNAVDGRVLVFRLRQDATGSRIPVWDTKYSFVGDLATVTLSTAANAIDRIAFEYDSTTDKWYCISFIKGS